MEPQEQGRSARKRAAILEAASTIFLDKGYDGASMDDVAALAAVSKQTVYKNFADKQTLFTEIVMSTTSQVDGIVNLVAAALDGTDDLDRDLHDLGRKFLATIMRPPVLRLRRLIIASASRFPDLGRTWYERGFERVLATLSDCFGRLTKQGLLAVDDPLVAADNFAGLLLWIPVNKAMFHGDDEPYTPAELERHADAAVGTFLAAYRPPPQG